MCVHLYSFLQEGPGKYIKCFCNHVVSKYLDMMVLIRMGIQIIKFKLTTM